MNIFTTLAQYGTDSLYNDSNVYTYSTTSVSTDPAAAAGAILIISLVYIVVLAAVYVAYALLLGRIFKKAGVPSWIGWVPVYNTWKLLEIGGQQGFWSVLFFLPIVNIVSAVMMYISMYHIGKKLGKDGAFVVLAIFLPLVWMIWLAVDHSKWNDKASTAPSLHRG